MRIIWASVLPVRPEVSRLILPFVLIGVAYLSKTILSNPLQISERISQQTAPGNRQVHSHLLNTLSRVAKYVLVKAVWLALTVVIGIFLSVVVINYGGYIDQIFRAQVDDALMGFGKAGGFKGVPVDQIPALQEKMKWEMEEAYGLHEPFLSRCIRWSLQAIRLDLGKSYQIAPLGGPSSQSADVRTIILQRLPNTLLLSGVTNLILFFVSVSLALSLSRKHGSWWDKAVVTLSPLSAAPNWIYGVILTVILAAQLHWLPFGGMFDKMPPSTKLGYIPIVLKHMVLPGLSIALSTIFQSIYAWRTFFMMHSEDDHVEMARAKGFLQARCRGIQAENSSCLSGWNET